MSSVAEIQAAVAQANQIIDYNIRQLVAAQTGLEEALQLLQATLTTEHEDAQAAIAAVVGAMDNIGDAQGLARTASESAERYAQLL